MKISKDNYITNVVVNSSDIKDIRLFHGNNKKLSQWYDVLNKPDILVNASLFLSNGTPIEYFMTEGNVLSKSDWCTKGFGINWDGTVQFGEFSSYYRDFTSAFPMLVYNYNVDLNFIPSDISGRNPRTVFSKTEDGIMITTVDGRQANKPGMTLNELANYMHSLGVIHSANLDGGGSTHLMVNGETVNNPSENRAVSNVIAIWLKGDDKKVSKKIVVDAGHNHSKFDTGAEGNGLREQDITFEIARLTGEFLKNSGLSVKLTRNNLTDNIGTNLSTSLSTRAKIANDWKADLFVSIHCNAHNSNASGTETYVYSTGNSATSIATKVNNEIVGMLGTVNRGIKARPDLAVLKQTGMPSMLIETAFISSREDAEKLKNRQSDFARAIAKGICESYGVKFVGIKQESPVQENKYSYDDTVEGMIVNGVITAENMEYWEKTLDGREILNKDYVRTIFDRYNEILEG